VNVRFRQRDRVLFAARLADQQLRGLREGDGGEKQRRGEEQ
jgi:hypothetical protein